MVTLDLQITKVWIVFQIAPCVSGREKEFDEREREREKREREIMFVSLGFRLLANEHGMVNDHGWRGMLRGKLVELGW